ncbi:MAG: ABC transporter permease subunit [Deltaproteobacteria bacterium]|nr:ABC transporter permease subunit [Deltaproteobacteria bacterium]
MAFWEISGRAHWVDQSVVPRLSATVEAILEMWISISLGTHILISFGRIILGLLIGLFLAVPSAYVLARVLPVLGERADSLLRIFALINPYCFFPVFVILFGLGETPKIAVLAWVSMWPIFFSSQNVFKNTDPQLIKMARSMNLNKAALFFRLTLPSGLPQIFTGLRLGVEMSFFILIAAEMTGATAGLGWLIHNAGASYQIARLYGTGLCVVVLGVLLNRFLILVRKGFLPWSGGLTIPWLQNTDVSPKNVSKKVLYFWCLIFLLAASMALFQIFRGVNLTVTV